MMMTIDGLPVINADAGTTIKITKADIGRANRKEPDQSVIARCCRRQLHVKEVRVHLGRVYLRTNETSWVRYITPPALRSEIIAFDRGGAFEAGEYLLSSPPKSKQTNKQQGTNKRTPGAGKKKKAPHVVTNVRGGPA